MKQLFLSLFTLAFIAVTNAQTIKESVTTEPDLAGWEVKTMLYDNSGSVYVLRIHFKLKLKFIIEKYNSETLALDFYKMYGQEEFKGNGMKIPVGLFLLSGKPYLLVYEEAPEGCASRLFSIGSKGELTYKSELVNSGTADDNVDQYGRYTHCESNEIRPTGLPDMPYVYIYGVKDGKNTKEKLIYLNSELNLVKTLSIAIPARHEGLRTFDFVSDKEGNSYLLVHAYDFYSTEEMTNKYLLYKIDKTGTFTEIKTEPGDNKVMSNAKLHLNKKGDPILVGVYKDNKKPDLFQGFFLAKLNSSTTNITPTIQYAFNDSFVAKAVNFKALYEVEIRNIYENKDDSYTVFFKMERINPGSGTMPERNYFTGMRNTVNFAGRPITEAGITCAVSIVNINDKGINWSKTITSNKLYGTDNNALMGAFLTQSPKGYNLIFDGMESSAEKKKKPAPVFHFYTFEENGNYTKSAVSDVNEWTLGEALFKKTKYPCIDEKGNIYRPWHTLLQPKIKIVKFQFD